MTPEEFAVLLGDVPVADVVLTADGHELWPVLPAQRGACRRLNGASLSNVRRAVCQPCNTALGAVVETSTSGRCWVGHWPSPVAVPPAVVRRELRRRGVAVRRVDGRPEYVVLLDRNDSPPRVWSWCPTHGWADVDLAARGRVIRAAPYSDV